MKKTALFSALLLSSLLYAEGDNSIILQQKINEQSEKIDGMQSIIEGLTDRVQSLEEYTKNYQSQGEAINKNNKLIQDLAKMIDDMDAKCVKKDDLRAILAKYQVANQDSSSQTATVVGDKDKLLDNSINAFRDGDYDKAKVGFLLLDKQGYKMAISDYYLGEINYYSKNYKDALFYYKKSAKADANASYLDTLLLHSGISLEKTDKKEDAKKFYQTIVDKYPQSNSAKIAKEKLDGMQ